MTKTYAWLLLAGMVAVAGCSGSSAPPASAPAAAVDPGALETPNRLPPGLTGAAPAGPDTGVVGVTHDAP